MSAFDCIVVGGGYSGLSAAKKLKGEGKHVLLLEARNRVGGRAMTVPTSDGHYWDNGASFLGVQQPIMYSLAKEFGVHTFNVPTSGKTVIYCRGQAKSYTGLIPAMRVWELVDVGLALNKFEALAKMINLEQPWKTPNAMELDSMTVREWVHKKCWTKGAKDSMRFAVDLIWGQNWSNVSMLHALWYCRAGVSFESLCSIENGAQEQYIKGGGQLIANKILEHLTDSIVHLEEPVIGIKYNADGAEVSTAKGIYTATRVIFAMPPHQVLKVRFERPLPIQKTILMQHSPPGFYYKVFAVYKTPFWRAKGYRGEATSPDGFIQLTNDASPESGSPAKLMGFSTGAKGYEFSLLSFEERKKIALKEWAATFGPEAAEPIDFHIHSMTEEEYIGGCPVATLAPGMWTSLGEWLWKPIDCIHWAGTETSTRYCGYMEGACFAGQRAADEVLEILGK